MMICTNCGKTSANTAANACPHCRMNGTLKRNLPDTPNPALPDALPAKPTCRNCGHALENTVDKCPACRFPRHTGINTQHGSSAPGQNALSLQTRIFN